ncbi:MAG: DUF1653 domain-containing protein [Candidatus Saccharimonadales bacterium]
METPRGNELDHPIGYPVRHTETGEYFNIYGPEYEIIEDLKLAGIYEHYKSTLENPKFYEVDYVVRSSDNGECFVIYHPLYESDDTTVPARPIDNFTDNAEVDREEVPRFRLIRFNR